MNNPYKGWPLIYDILKAIVYVHSDWNFILDWMQLQIVGDTPRLSIDRTTSIRALLQRQIADVNSFTR